MEPCLELLLGPQEDLREVAEGEGRSVRSETVDLDENSLQVDISDALSEREKVKFTVHTKVSLPPALKERVTGHSDLT